MTTLLTMAENEASIEEEVIVNSCTASQLDDLLAAYDMHELANKMAAAESDPTTASDLLLSPSSGGETGVRHFSPSHHVKEGENGDDRELANDGDCVDAATRNLFTDENRIEMNEPPAAVAQTVPVLKVKRDRRKRPPNKSILRPVFSPDSSPRFHSQTLLATTGVTTDNMIESIPDLFRSLSSSSQTSGDLDHVGRPKVTRDVLRNPNGNVTVLNNSGVLEQIKQAVLPTFGSSFGPPSRLKLEASSVAGYICPDCSDHFWLESSFAQHVQRRSVYINFFCHFCSKLLIFYNRCALLGHARIHRERHQPCDVGNATLAPLEKDLIPCIQDSKIVVPSALTLVTKHDNRASQKRRRKDTSSPIVTIMIPEKETNSNTVFTTTKNPGNLQQTETVQSHSCCECHQNCKTRLELCEHFGENREVPPTTDSECPQCHMICTSRCSLTSHQRMHAKDRPYVCPECGLRVSELWQDFKNHVTDVCLHHSRTLGFRCPACGVLSVNPEQLKTHVTTDHGVVLYKCQCCPRAFKSGRSFDSHRRSAHADDQSTATYSSIQKCPLCDAVFHRQSLLTKHLDTHFQEIFAAAKYVFRCLECGRLSENKADLREHLRAVHSFPQASEKKHGKPQKKKQKQSPHVDHEAELNVVTSRTSDSTAICDHCQREFRTMLGLNVHRFRSHGIRINQSNEATTAAAESNDKQAADGDRPPPITIKIKKKKKSTTLSNGSSYILDNTHHGHSGVNGETTDDCSSILTKPTCKLCYDEFPDVRALAEHGYLHIQEGFLVCMLCSNLTFTNKIALSRHLEKHAILTNYPSTCVYCLEVLKSRTQTAVHWREEHGLSSFQCPHCETRYLYHKSLSRHIREVHRGLRKVKKKSDMPDLDTSSAVDGSICPEQDEEMVGDISETVTDPSQSKEPDATSPAVESSAESVVPETVEDAAVPENVPVREDWLEKSGEYRCAKCDFCSLTRSSFQLHIVQHKMTANDTYQCAECGTCFVVAPSLHKHLKLVHKVKDLEAYQEFIRSVMTADNGGMNSDQTHEAHLGGLDGANGDFGMESANGLQCSICHLCFDNEQLLKTHSRSHGMAFLQAAASKRSLSGYSSDTSSPSSTPTKCTTK